MAVPVLEKGNDVEVAGGENKLRYPLGVFFIVFNGFCDRFAYYGIKAILILYLSNVLLFSEDDSTQIYHLFFMFCTFTPLFGAMIADSVLGKFKTILIFTVVYIGGNLLLAAAATPPLQFPETPISILSLVLLAIGTGFVKPCVVAMGGDQFKLPEQEEHLKSYFSLFYFAISAGGLIATFITPIFRKDVSCFGGDCYTLAYSATSAVMAAALIAFIIGKAFYKSEAGDSEEGNIIVEIVKCIFHAVSVKWKAYRKGTLTHFSRKSHWLDYAADKYSTEIISDVKAVLKVLVLYLPLPMFWALMEQQGSRWTLQANRMNGDVFGYALKPDHIQVVNPLLVLALIPFFDKIVYPFLGKFGVLTKPLEKLACGGLLAAIAFLMSGFVELNLEANSSMIHFPAQNVTLLNKLPCNLLAYSLADTANTTSYQIPAKLVANETFIFRNITTDPAHPKIRLHLELEPESEVVEGPKGNCDFMPQQIQMNGTDVTIENVDNRANFQLNFEPRTQELKLEKSPESIDKSKVLHMLWLLPQYITITVAEVMFAVTGMEFSYSQAPATMKSVMQSAWLLTIASGNLIVAVIAKAKFFSAQSSEFFLFAFLMFIDILVFIWMARKYTRKNAMAVGTSEAGSSTKSFHEMRAMSFHSRLDKRPNFRKTIP